MRLRANPGTRVASHASLHANPAMNYAVQVRENQPFSEPVQSHALDTRYPTIEAAARAGRCEARRQARMWSAEFEFKVLDFLGRYTTGGIVKE